MTINYDIKSLIWLTKWNFLLKMYLQHQYQVAVHRHLQLVRLSFFFFSWPALISIKSKKGIILIKWALHRMTFQTKNMFILFEFLCNDFVRTTHSGTICPWIIHQFDFERYMIKVLYSLSFSKVILWHIRTLMQNDWLFILFKQQKLQHQNVRCHLIKDGCSLQRDIQI